MIVGKIWDSEYPWDVRVEKVCQALNDRGHTVHLVCRNRRREPLHDRIGALQVHRMPAWPGPLESATSFPAFINPRWYRHARQVFARERVDVVLCRDLPLAPLALAVARSLDVPVVFDIAEHYPGLLKDLYNAHDFRFGNLLVRNPWLAAGVERAVMPRADGTLVVVEEMADRLAAMGVARESITVVSNTPTRERIDRMIPKPPGSPRGPEPWLVYLGKVERSRGLGVVIESLALLRGRGVTVRLDVYGDGSSYDTDQRAAAAAGLGDRVVFHGRKPYDTILNGLSRYDAGIIPHHATDHWNYTIQNKMFDYMAAGLAVIVSSMPPARRIVRETGAGLAFDDRDPASLASLLERFPSGPELDAMGAAGRRAVLERYNWDEDGGRLVTALEQVVARRRQARAS